MTDKEYRAAEGVNKSTLWLMHKSPAHYLWFSEHQREDTQALRLGRAIHSAILTPDSFAGDWAVLPEEIDRRTKAGKEAYAEFEASSAGREILTAAEAEQVRNIAEAVLSSVDTSELLNLARIREEPIFWTDRETGLLCKCRVDAMSIEQRVLIDLKTTTDADTLSFYREAARYGYDVQAAHYSSGFFEKFGHWPDWYFIAVEKAEPFAAHVFRADDSWLDQGEAVRRDLLAKLKHCRESGEFPGYDLSILYGREESL